MKRIEPAPAALESSLALLRKSNAELAQSTASLTEANDRLARFLGVPVPSAQRRAKETF